MQYEHVTRVGRYTTVDTGNATETLHDGSRGITLEELRRLERRAAIAVLTKIDTLEGAELRFARKALDLSQAELAETLGVLIGDVQRWEAGVDVIGEGTRAGVVRILKAEDAGERPLPTIRVSP